MRVCSWVGVYSELLAMRIGLLFASASRKIRLCLALLLSSSSCICELVNMNA